MINRQLFWIAGLMFCTAACQKPEDGPASASVPPALVSSVPKNGATEIAGTSLDLVLAFDQNVMCPTAESGRITVDNGASVDKVNAYMTNVTVSLSGLVGGVTYTVTLPEGTVKGYRDNVAEDIRIAFTTKQASGGGQVQEIDKNLVTADPIPNASGLYDYLRSVYGKKTVSGAIAKVNWNLDEIEWISRWTGREPAMATFDYIHLFASPANWIDYSDITPAKTWFDKGGIVSACWHWNVPNVEGGTGYTCTPGNGSKNSDGNWTTVFRPKNIFVEGSWEKRVADADLEKISGYLKLLQDEGIPVVWRPLHEAAGNTYTQWHSGAWFWWGADGGETYVRLWRYMFDYFKEKGLRNLIWVWTTQTSSLSDDDSPFYPGDEYVDIVGKDIYNVSAPEDIASIFGLVSGNYPGKMVTLSEFGNVAKMGEQWSAGAKWLYFMPWYDYGNDKTENFAHCHAPISWWKAAFEDDAVVDLSELPSDLYD